MHRLLASQIILLVTLGICALLNPTTLTELPQGGLSNFGTYPKTTLIFSFGCIISALLLFLGAKNQPSKTVKNLSIAYAAGLLILLASTYTYKNGPLLESLHISIGFILAGFQLVTAWMLTRISPLDGYAVTGLLFLGSGLVAGGLTATSVVGLLFTAQCLSGLGYGILLVRAAR